jgi:hypothetical protein
MNIAKGFSGHTVHGFQNAGLQVDITYGQTMKAPFAKRMPVTTFLRDRFFSAFSSFETKDVLMDVYKNRQRVAPFVMTDASKPVNIHRDGYHTDRYTAPFINIAQPIDAELLQRRIPGEAVFNGMSPAERQAYHIAQFRQEMDDMITRREEVMVAEILQTGKVTVTGYIDDAATAVRTDTIDFGFSNIEQLTGTSVWSSDQSKKYRDLENMVNVIRQAGYNPTVAIFGQDAWNLLRDDEKFMTNHFDLRRAELGVLRPELNIQNGNGYTYLGYLPELGLDMFLYNAWYWDDAQNKMMPYIKPKRVIIASEAIGERLYGANTIIPDGSEEFVTVVGPRVTQVFVDRENSTKKLVMKSRPLPVPYDVSAWGVLVVDSEA